MKQTMNCSGSLLILLLVVFPCMAEVDSETEPLGEFCNKDTNISRNSKVSANIVKLSPQLVSETQSTGYISTSTGNEPDKVFGLAQCRGDVISNGDCSTCLGDAAEQIRKRFPDQADARIWYDFCFLRYNTRDLIGEIDTGFGILYGNVESVSDPKRFNKELEDLTDKIRSEAVESKNKGLGKGETKLSPFVRLYALVQCTRDLSAINCAQCLGIAVGNFAGFCNNRKGCRVLYSSCYVRYELYPFFLPVDSSSGNTTLFNSTTSSTKVVTTHKL